ncbi:MAG: type II toxin-antitoxin system RelE/ParE family toxin [Nitrospirae bacterium]|nr:type II toxin-antitoxin system RelE/ParE family toxin [Nitrospirota bacterium]
MILSFGDNATEDLFNGVGSKNTRVFQAILKVVRRKLDMVNTASRLDDLLSPPNNRLELLKGDLKGFYSIRVNDQYRIIFKWQNGNAHEVRIKDYH